MLVVFISDVIFPAPSAMHGALMNAGHSVSDLGFVFAAKALTLNTVPVNLNEEASTPESHCVASLSTSNGAGDAVELQGGGHLRGVGPVDAALQRDGRVPSEKLGRRPGAEPGGRRRRSRSSPAVGVRQPGLERRAGLRHCAVRREIPNARFGNIYRRTLCSAKHPVMRPVAIVWRFVARLVGLCGTFQGAPYGTQDPRR